MKIQSSQQFIEQKYMIHETDVEKIMKCVAHNIEEDEHFKYTVYNIYYSQVSDDLISKVFKKRINKERIRLRSYGIPQVNDPVYIEIKDTLKNMTTKRRVEMSLDEAYELLSKQHECGDNEVDELLRNNGLIPKMFVGYERVAYCSKFNPQVRITFSMNMRYRTNDFRLCDIADNISLFQDDSILMEVKGEELPEWLLEAISKSGFKQLNPQKVSKTFKKIEEQYQLSNILY